MSKKGKKPPRITVGGERWNATVMRVVQRDELGRPLLLRVVRDDETVELSEDENANHFIIPYVKEGVL